METFGINKVEEQAAFLLYCCCKVLIISFLVLGIIQVCCKFILSIDFGDKVLSSNKSIGDVFHFCLFVISCYFLFFNHTCRSVILFFVLATTLSRNKNKGGQALYLYVKVIIMLINVCSFKCREIVVNGESLII